MCFGVLFLATQESTAQPIGLLVVAMVMTPIIAAMGAAQLAMIAGTSFQGGGSGGGAATPSTVSVGKRRNTVDLGKTKSARGELAYMRGDQGTRV